MNCDYVFNHLVLNQHLTTSLPLVRLDKKALLQPLSPLIFQFSYRLKNEGPKSIPRVTSRNKAIITTASESIPTACLLLLFDIVQIISKYSAILPF